MIKSAALTLFLVLSITPCSAETLFAIAVSHTPVLNTPDFNPVFGDNGEKSQYIDDCGQLRALEFVALPGTVFTIEDELARNGHIIFRVSTVDYPYPSPTGYFVDARSVRTEKSRPPERAVILPPEKEIIAALKKQNGVGYVWGGNTSGGVKIATWYPSATISPLSGPEPGMLAGVDCSGLLYEATGGYTPRNTSSLVSFGEEVPIAGKSIAEISAELRPLDLIVWPGHVLIVLDNSTVIESRLVCGNPAAGVRIRSRVDALSDIMKKRNPVNRIKDGKKEFAVRRWYGIR